MTTERKWEPRQSVYDSKRRADCTAIKNTLNQQGFNAYVCALPGDNAGHCVAVPVSEYERAKAVVWGDEVPPASGAARSPRERIGIMTQAQFLLRGKVQFEAEWIERQHADANGEWNPDRDEYACSTHATREEAERAAIEASKKSGVEWILVAEQKYIGHEWVDQRRWTGDWDGLHEETFTADHQ